MSRSYSSQQAKLLTDRAAELEAATDLLEVTTPESLPPLGSRQVRNVFAW